MIMTGGVLWARLAPGMYFQERNLQTAKAVLLGGGLLTLWWLLFSRASWRRRFQVATTLALLLAAAIGLFRIRGVSGDLLPIIEFRWKPHASIPAESAANPAPPVSPPESTNHATFPQFLGPDRNGVLAGPKLETDWAAHPPQVLWRRKVGAAWSGFAVAGNLAVTMEQRGDQECTVAYELTSGREVWVAPQAAHFNTTIAGEGPRATPTIVGDRVFCFGATGWLGCLELATGHRVWTVDVLKTSGGKQPDWGFTSAPLLVDGLVIVHGGENAKHSLHAFKAEDGWPVWSAGEANPSYAAATLASLAGVPQVLAFNQKLITAHDPASGRVLWSHPWGNGNVVCSSPLVVSSNQVLFSSGYGYGSELLEVASETNGLSAKRIWKSIRLKSKFGHLFEHDGCAFGLDDGVFTAIDLKDGSLRWKEGRYGHGQGLVVGVHYLLMAENGELVLLQPTPDAAQELARLAVFSAKTWNPPALAGRHLLLRNDQEAACLLVPTAGTIDSTPPAAAAR